MSNPIYLAESNGNLQFGSMSHAPLPDGYYKVTATAEIHHGAIDQWAQEGEFYISGPRFVLPPADLQSVYPPDRSAGPYSTTLPTLTLNRGGLPWERFPEAGGTVSTGRSWLALLLFTEAEMQGTTAVTTQVMQLSDYLPPGEITEMDDVNSQVVVASIPTSLAQEVLPSYDDLTYVAHLRKSISGTGATEGPERAVILCNRLPLAGQSSYVFLVSLEGKFSGGQFTYPTSGPLQLPVLSAWQFTNDSAGSSFLQMLQEMNMNPSTLRIPPSSVQLNPSPEPYWSKGYVALPHGLRNGQSTASWYHGPLAPSSPSVPLTFPAPSADALVNYDQTTGMFDEAYASAWVLGRMMALQNQKFALTLSQRKQQDAMAQRQAQQASRNSHLPVVTGLDRWNQIMAAQTAYVRMNAISLVGVCTSLVGDVSVVFTGGAVPMVVQDDTFGRSLTPVGSPYQGTVNDAASGMSGDFCISLWLHRNALGDASTMNTTVFLVGRGSQSRWITVEVVGSALRLTVDGIQSQATGMQQTEGWHNFALTVWTDSSGVLHVDLHMDGVEVISTTVQPYILEGSVFTSLAICSQESSVALDSWADKCANFRMFTDPLDAQDIAEVMDDDTRLAPLYPFFNQLSLLREVPFSYLIPTEDMLLPASTGTVPVGGTVPDNCIRFFTIDRSWVNSLLDGAFSIGRNSQAQLDRDRATLQELGITQLPVMTGFVMRGMAVSGWPDLAADGYDEVYTTGQVPNLAAALRILRMERLSENTLLCIFQGNVKTLDLHMRKTALHSGVSDITGTTATKFMRSLQGVELDPPGNSITISLNSSLVVSLSVVAASMASILERATVDAGIFGMEMMEGTPIVRITAQS